MRKKKICGQFNYYNLIMSAFAGIQTKECNEILMIEQIIIWIPINIYPTEIKIVEMEKGKAIWAGKNRHLDTTTTTPVLI